MSRRKKKLPILEQVEILDAGAEGKAVAKIDGLVLFTKGAVPGDIADIQVTRKKRSFMEGYPVKFHQYSDKRADPICDHFGTCGGCKWQNLQYNEQLFYKHKQVTDHLTRIGGIELPEIKPILASDKTTYYRNKLEYTFSNRKWLTDEEIRSGEEQERNGLGFHIPGRYDRVLDIEQCFLQREPSNSIRLAIRKYALENGLTFFDLNRQEGFLRNLLIRTSNNSELMVILSFFHEDQPAREALLDFLKNEFPAITSLQYVVNEKKNDTLFDQDIIAYAGPEHIIEEMPLDDETENKLQFRIGPKSFYQTNSDQAYTLYKVARDMARLSGNENVYDLYTGIGTIAQFVASRSKHVVGIEAIPEAIENAQQNASLNKITNTTFYAGDVKDILSDEFVSKHGAPDVIITDPPRAGMHADVVDAIQKASPERIVYVSCNPATQARDLALLNEAYKVVEVQPVDMFPHTHHVENVVGLERR